MWFGRILPELVQEFGPSRKLDVKCGFSKQFLKGRLDEQHTS